MGYFLSSLGLCAAVTLLSVAVVGAEEKDPLKPRVARIRWRTRRR